jgi:hypothetical protein
VTVPHAGDRRDAARPASSGGRQIEQRRAAPDDNAATRISSAPVHPNSDRYIAYILGSGGNRFLHADFGENPDYGIPYVVVPPEQPAVSVTFDYADESDLGPYPLPANVPIEGGSDRHALVVRRGECLLYELFALERSGSGWRAGSGAIFDLRSNALRPDRWTSADAACRSSRGWCAMTRCSVAHRACAALTVSRTQRAFTTPRRTSPASDHGRGRADGLRLRLRADSRSLALHGPGARGAGGCASTGCSCGRQRVELVHQRRDGPALERHRPTS